MVKGEGSGARAELRRLLEVTALTGLAIVQPTLDVLGRSPETFVFRRGGRDPAGRVRGAGGRRPGPGPVGAGLLTGLLGARVRAGAHLATLAGLLVLAVLVALKSADVLFGVAALGGGRRDRRPRGGALPPSRGGPALPRVPSRCSPCWPSAPSSSHRRRPPCSAGATTTSSTIPGRRTPLVVVVLDEFPTAAIIDSNGEVDAERFPNLATLADESRWYRNYTTVSNFTLHAVPALLSGMAPDSDDVPLLADHPDNLFTLLGGTYEFNVSEAITRLCPGELCPSDLTATDHAGLRGITDDTVDVVQELVSLDAFPGPESDFFVEEVTDPTDPTFEHGRDAEVQPTRFRDFLGALAPTAQPGLHYLHLVLPHEPWRFFPDGTEYASPGAIRAVIPTDAGRGPGPPASTVFASSCRPATSTPSWARPSLASRRAPCGTTPSSPSSPTTAPASRTARPGGC